MIAPQERFDLVAIGEPLIELNQERGQVDTYRQGFGGDTSNCVIAAARLGARTAYISRVGGDAFGRMLLALWQREGVASRGVEVDADATTGLYFVAHGPGGHEFSYLRAGSAASRMRPADLPRDILGSAGMLHVSGISMAISTNACDTVLEALDVARGAGAKIAFDPNLRLKLWPLARARAVILAAARHADYFLPSYEEACALSGLERVDDVLDWASDLGPDVIVLKQGAAGASVASPEGRTRIRGHVVASVDATGAGDCFDGAFLARISRGDAPPEAARFANAAAALATTAYGAVAPLPREDDVRAFMRATQA